MTDQDYLDYQELRKACQKLIDYRSRSALNFQLEKADTYIHQMMQVLYKDEFDDVEEEVVEPCVFDNLRNSDTSSIIASVKRFFLR